MSAPVAIRHLRAAIKRSGLSSSRYAKTVLLRDARTVRRWLKGETRIPPAVVTFLKRDFPLGGAR